jgi:hypothetical protein
MSVRFAVVCPVGISRPARKILPFRPFDGPFCVQYR